MNGEEDESGATATVVLIGDDKLLISHIGDSSVVCIFHHYWIMLLMRKFTSVLCFSMHKNYQENLYCMEDYFDFHIWWYVEDWMSMKLHDFLVEPCLFLKVLSRSGKAEVLTSPHRPYGSNQASLQEIKRIREAGGWVCFPCSFIFSHSFWPSSVVNILYYYMSIFNIVKIEVLIWKLWQLRMRTNLSYLGYETIFSFLVLLFMYCGLVVRETKTCNTVCFPQWNHSQILSWY